jgi:chromosome segregation and condensation protein ScpB
VGRPILYATTPAFLQPFGLTSLDDLPPMVIPGDGGRAMGVEEEAKPEGVEGAEEK